MKIFQIKKHISQALQSNIHAVRLGLVASLMIFPFTSAQAQSAGAANMPPGQTYQNWRLICEPATTRCYIFQRTDLQTTGQQILNVVLGNLGPKESQVLHLTIPLGVYIPSGIALKIGDSGQMPIPIQTCTPKGCEAMVDLKPQLLSDLEGAKVVNVAFLDAVTRKQITVGVTMAGFREAVLALRRHNVTFR